jgi:hypothetical protein
LAAYGWLEHWPSTQTVVVVVHWPLMQLVDVELDWELEYELDVLLDVLEIDVELESIAVSAAAGWSASRSIVPTLPSGHRTTRPTTSAGVASC